MSLALPMYDQNKFHYALFRGKGNYLSASYQQVYTFWKNIWSELYDELNINKTVFSDEFRRQDFVTAIFYENRPVALIFFEEMDLMDPTCPDHSFFRIFDNQHFEHLVRLGIKKVLCVGNVTVHPEWRRAHFTPSLCSVAIGLSVNYLQTSSADAIICYTRNDRKMNRAFEEFGAIPIKRRLLANGIESDLLFISKTAIKNHDDPQVQNFVDSLWSKRNLTHLKDPHLDLNEDIQNYTNNL